MKYLNPEVFYGSAANNVDAARAEYKNYLAKIAKKIPNQLVKLMSNDGLPVEDLFQDFVISNFAVKLNSLRGKATRDVCTLSVKKANVVYTLSFYDVSSVKIVKHEVHLLPAWSKSMFGEVLLCEIGVEDGNTFEIFTSRNYLIGFTYGKLRVKKTVTK